MSYKAMDWAFEQECGDAMAKLVLITLAKHADDKGQCFPSASRIAKLANTTRRTVHRKLNELKEAGLITAQNRGKEGKKTSNIYTMGYVTQRQGVGTESHNHRDTASHRIDKTNKSNNISSSINETDGHNEKGIDWSAMAEKAMKGKDNGKRN